MKLAVAIGLVIAAIFVIAHFHRSAGAVLAAALGRDPGFAPAEIGFVIGITAFVSAACQPFAGVVLDRYGALRAAAALAVLGALGQAFFALPDSAAGLAFGRALIGIGFATAVSGVYLFLVGLVRPESFSTWAAAVLAIGGTVGGFLASTPLAVALDSVGREPVFLGFAVATALMAGAAFLLAWKQESGGTGRQTEPVAETLRGLPRS